MGLQAKKCYHHEENTMPNSGRFPDSSSVNALSVIPAWIKDSDGSDAADLSVTQHSSEFRRPRWATKACISIGWTAPLGEEPIGTLDIVVLGHVGALTGVSYPVAISSPAGSADGEIIMSVDIGGAPALKLTYTVTSGGTGAVWTGADGTGSPSITWSV
jgi:hypothetical protein